MPGTIESVRRQTYPYIEYLVVDGASKDRSLSIIQQFAAEMPNLSYISEPDKGLYDAMNKGLRLATGDYVWFLNGGDHLHAADTVERIAALAVVGRNAIPAHDDVSRNSIPAYEHADVLYGETLLVNDARQPAGTMSELSTRRLPAQLHWRDYLGGMLVVHQSFVPRRALVPEYMAGNLCADYDWCIRILKQSRSTVNTGLILTDYLMGGMSKQRHQQSLRDRFDVMRAHFGLPLTLLAHGKIVIRALWHRLRRWGREKY